MAGIEFEALVFEGGKVYINAFFPRSMLGQYWGAYTQGPFPQVHRKRSQHWGKPKLSNVAIAQGGGVLHRVRRSEVCCNGPAHVSEKPDSPLKLVKFTPHSAISPAALWTHLEFSQACGAVVNAQAF